MKGEVQVSSSFEETLVDYIGHLYLPGYEVEPANLVHTCTERRLYYLAGHHAHVRPLQLAAAANLPALPVLACQALNTLTAAIHAHDWSSARAHLVTSVPGLHKIDEQHKYGHMRLRRLLQQVGQGAGRAGCFL